MNESAGPGRDISISGTGVPRPTRLPKLDSAAYPEPQKPSVLAPRPSGDPMRPASVNSTNASAPYAKDSPNPKPIKENSTYSSKPPSIDTSSSSESEDQNSPSKRLHGVIRDASTSGSLSRDESNGTLPNQVVGTTEDDNQTFEPEFAPVSLGSPVGKQAPKSKSRLAHVTYANEAHSSGDDEADTIRSRSPALPSMVPSTSIPANPSTSTPEDVKRQNLSIHAVTFNMASKTPQTIPQTLLKGQNANVDIYVIGTQESGPIAEWEQLLLTALSPDFVKLSSSSLMAMHLVIFIRSTLVSRISHIRISNVATGVGNVLGNKGGVAVSFQIDRIKVLCISSHFAAHDTEINRRNLDYKRIKTGLFTSNLSSTTISPRVASILGTWSKVSQDSKGTNNSSTRGSSDPLDSSHTGASSESPTHHSNGRQSPDPKTPQSSRSNSADLRTEASLPEDLPPLAVNSHDVVLWMGDMNYRINGNTRAIMHLIETQGYEVLHANDQLRIQQKKGKVFKHYEEQPINFAPTYKFEINSDAYELKRVPSWTDRVLYRVMEDASCMLTPMYYDSVTDLKSSDHRPVVAGFELVLSHPPLSPQTSSKTKLFNCCALMWHRR